jgi:hypothetical protein
MADKQGWLYNIDTGLLIGPTIIQESPLEPGVWLYPPNATKTAPPAVRPGWSIFFIDGEWEQREIIVPIPEPVDPRDNMAASMIQIRLTLLANDLLEELDAYIRESASAHNQLIWRYAFFLQRNDHFTNFIADVLNLDEEDLDTLFIDAARVTI